MAAGRLTMAHYADPGYQADHQPRYALDNEEQVRAAWGYINQRDNARRYTPEQRRLIHQRIQAAGRKYGIQYGHARDDHRGHDLPPRGPRYDVVTNYRGDLYDEFDQSYDSAVAMANRTMDAIEDETGVTFTREGDRTFDRYRTMREDYFRGSAPNPKRPNARITVEVVPTKVEGEERRRRRSSGHRRSRTEFLVRRTDGRGESHVVGRYASRDEADRIASRRGGPAEVITVHVDGEGGHSARKSGTYTYVREGGPKGRLEYRGMSWRQATDLAGQNVYYNGLASRAEAQRWEAQIREGEPISFGPYTWTISREGGHARTGKGEVAVEDRPFVRRGLVETPQMRADREEREREADWRQSILQERWANSANPRYRRKSAAVHRRAWRRV